MTTTHRQTAEERREAVLAAALEAFARGGLHGTSTEDIADAAGISQPYLFRLFGTKKKLFLATVERCMADTLELFREAAGDQRGEEALRAMADAYVAMLMSDRKRLLAQMEAYAACDDPDVRDAMRAGYGKLHLFVETVSGVDRGSRGELVRPRDAPQRRRRDGSLEHPRAVGTAPDRGLHRARAPRGGPRRGGVVTSSICPRFVSD